MTPTNVPSSASPGPATGVARSTFLPFHVPDIGEQEIAAVVETLRSGWLTTGPKVREFEEAFAQAVGVRHAVALNSCTAALHLALEAIGLTKDDEVIVPTMTFAASAEVVRYFDATPVLVDCDADTLTVSAQTIEGALTSRTRAIMPVHFAGHPCDMDPILELARSRGLKVIEDAAHSLPASYRGRTIGTIGDITCFSFYATKTVTTGEGGMLTTAVDEYAERARLMSLHGISKDAWKRYTAEGSWRYDIQRPGYKYNLTDLAASLGIVQLRRALALRDARRRIAEHYDRGFADLPEVRVPARRGEVEHAWHLYAIRLDTAGLRIGRDELIESLRLRNIGTSVHFIPLHLHPYYRDTFGYRTGDFPNATTAFGGLVSLPIYSRMTDADVESVIDAVRAIVRQARR